MNQFFPRGPGPLVSVLFPTRGRPETLGRALGSLVGNATEPGQVEILLKVDDDDLDTITFLKDYIPVCRSVVKAFVTPRGRGYLDIHHWLNALAAESTGDWLFVFNDDAVVTNAGWDANLHGASVWSWHGRPQDVCLLIPHIDDGKQKSFFLLRRKTYELLGKVCGSPYGDAWAVNVLNSIHASAWIHSIKIEHRRVEGGYYYQCGSVGDYWEDMGTLMSLGATQGQLAAAQGLLSHLAGVIEQRVWSPSPGTPGWYLWKQHDRAVTANLYVRGDGLCLRFGGVPGGEECKVAELGGVWSSVGGE